ncbi:MAG: single-stranded-DNA-specific exonuclease RecJ [Magnetococcales bacterium]|nr:single-stranded-DNA-specific exonuclease RecJ [Magnetococcales bacterium]
MTPRSGPLSFSGKEWRPRAEVQPCHVEVAQSLGVGEWFAPLLAGRRLESVEGARAYFQPRLTDLADPSGMLGMDQAVHRLVQALERGEKIAIFGDYDVDGATSSALLARYFRGLGSPARVYIPNRFTEGYGPNPQAMETLAAEGVKVVVTVDCGITAFEALERAVEVGLEVIVTDHHQPRDHGALPSALAILDPNQPGDEFPHKELAGVGVAFYLAMALNRALDQRGWFSAGRVKPDLKLLLDLVAVGTIADMAKLSGLNRLLVSHGLNLASRTTNAGLRAMFRRIGWKDFDPSQPLGAGKVGFHVGPRINAAGRLGECSLGYELLATDDPGLADEIAGRLELANRERQQLEEVVLNEALERIATEGLLEGRLGLVVSGEGWHAGVVGIVASRLVERFHRPTAVVAVEEGSGVCRGSARSISGVNLLAAVAAAAPLLNHYGGHAAAAGFHLSRENLAAFSDTFDAAIRRDNPPEVFSPWLAVDGPLSLDQSHHAVEAVRHLQPFGRGNPVPVFVVRRVMVEQTVVMKERHIRCQLRDERGHGMEALAFGVYPGPLGEGLMAAEGRTVDVAGVVEKEKFRGVERLRWMMQDARAAG